MQVVKFYDDLHKIPELGFLEYETSKYLKTVLKNAGFKITECTETGFYADLGSGGQIIALRADMDALAHIIDGAKCARHTCGHDAHMSMLLAAAVAAQAQGLIKRNTIRFLFQPAEELGTGALKMIESGALNGVEQIYGMHIRPIQECPYPKAIASMHFAASATLQIIIKGQAAHGARPHLGANAIDAATAAVIAARMIYLDPNKPFSIKATRLISDSGVTNSIPSEATLVFDLRAQFNETMSEIKERLEHAVRAAISANGCECELSYLNDIPAAMIDEELKLNAKRAIELAIGEENLIIEKYIPGGEDFFFYPRVLGIKAAFMGLGVDCTPGLHHPQMQLNKEALENGVKIWLELIKLLAG